jgi:hypothetical protein
MEILLEILVVGVAWLIWFCHDIRRNVVGHAKNYWLVNRDKIFEEQRKDREWAKSIEGGDAK